MTDERYLTNSVLRATQVLESFSREHVSFSNAELQKRLGLNKSSLRRILYTLEYAGFLKKDVKCGEYSLSEKLFKIGFVYLQQLDLYTLAKPELAELATQHGETAHLGILHGHDVLYIDRADSNRSVKLESLIGSTLPAYCTSIGKVLLAHADQNSIDEILDSVNLRSFTPNTITNRDQLTEHLKIIRQQGYALEDRELSDEITSIAAPVYDFKGNAVAGISVAGPFFRMESQEIQKQIIASVLKTADSISSKLGHVNPDSTLS